MAEAQPEEPEEPARRSGGSGSKITLQRHFEKLGLGTYEARVLVALLQVGAATAGQLAKLSQVTRPNVYPVLDSLSAKGLVYARPDKVTQWVCIGREEVVARLFQAREQSLREAQAQVARHRDEAAKILAKMAPESMLPPRPPVTIVDSDFEFTSLYHRLVETTTTELLVLNKGPYPGDLKVQPVVISALARGVRARALYETDELTDPGLVDLRVTMEAYDRVGVEGRVVDSLPIAMAILDRKTVLLGVDDPEVPELGRPAHIHAEYVPLAELCMNAFENLWSKGSPVGH